jgi:hypothetical protein
MKFHLILVFILFMLAIYELIILGTKEIVERKISMFWNKNAKPLNVLNRKANRLVKNKLN